MDLFDSVFHFP